MRGKGFIFTVVMFMVYFGCVKRPSPSTIIRIGKMEVGDAFKFKAATPDLFVLFAPQDTTVSSDYEFEISSQDKVIEHFSGTTNDAQKCNWLKSSGHLDSVILNWPRENSSDYLVGSEYVISLHSGSLSGEVYLVFHGF